MGCHFLLQGIFPTQGSNLGLLHYRQRLYANLHFLLELLPTDVSICVDPTCSSYYCDVLMVTFLFPSFFLHLLFGILPKGGAIFSFPFIYIWLFISIRANSCLVCGDNLTLFIYLFNFPNCSALAPGSSFRYYLKFLCAPPLKAKPKTDMLPTFGKHFLALWLHKMLQAHLAFSLPQAWSQPFLQRGLTPLTGEWASGMFPAARASSLRGPLSWETGNKCIYTNIGIHIVLCFFLYLLVHVFKKHECPPTNEWIKMWYKQIMEHDSALKRNEILINATTRMNLKSNMLSEINKTQKNKYCMIPLTGGT